jgi:homopolymeric O-antigen transport system permease protein
MLEVFHYSAFVKNLVLKDLKLKYRDSVLGFMWSLINPLLSLTVYTFAFKYVMRIQMENYVYFLMVGLLPWNFFSTSLMASTGAIVANGGLIKKVYFPRQTLPVATVLFGFAQFILAMAVFIPALVLVSGVSLGWAALLFFPVLLLHLLFTVGLALVLSAVTASLRDVAHFTEIGLQLLFWTTPIIYPSSMAPRALHPLFRISPLAAFAVAYQDVLFWDRVPSGETVAVLLAWTMAALAVGQVVFQRYSPTFAEEI